MQEYKYSVSCILDKSKTQSIWNANNPEYSVWSGTYEQNGKTFLLTQNSSTVAGVTIGLVNHLSAQNGLRYTWKNNVLSGSFKLTWNDGEVDGEVDGQMEMKDYSYHIMGQNYDKWGGNHSKMLTELAIQSGYNELNNELKLIYNTINANVNVYPLGQIAIHTASPQLLNSSKTDKVINKVINEEIIEEDIIGGMFNMFGDDDDE